MLTTLFPWCVLHSAGKTLVQAGGSCVKSDGSFDISKQCVASHPVCMSPGSGKCATVEEATAKPTTPPPTTAVACASFAPLGEGCNESQGKCCGGGPKNAKCTDGKVGSAAGAVSWLRWHCVPDT
jgi:hypothetical protein